MTIKRSAGILLHPTSFPSKYGIGDLGKEALRFIDFLSAAGQNLWQVFPLGPTGYGDSPYQSFSAFAGNPLIISPDLLIGEGLLKKSQAKRFHSKNENHVDFGRVINFKIEILKNAYNNFKNLKGFDSSEYQNFYKKNKFWLKDYSLFMAVKEFHGGIVWSEWNSEIAFREKNAVKLWEQKLSDETGFHKFLQFIFAKQWGGVKKYANQKGIQIIGDLPIFISYDSADLWANRSQFTVDEQGKLETVAGVPPDYFSATGQLWGNPLYRWNIMKKDGFKWWIKRFSQMYELFDIIRIDHFRGFEAFWEIPGGAPNAIEGRWVKAPGGELFKTLLKKLPSAKILAEDLGVITPEVEALRDKFEFPGMKILQFAFGKDGDKKFLPHNHIPNCCVYTGSHDNDTTKAFFEKARKKNPDIYNSACDYLNYYGGDITFALIKAAYASVANIVIIPLQDILDLGGEARMNFPGKLGGNWTWRYQKNQITKRLANKYKKLTELYERGAYAPEISEKEK